MSEDSKPVNTAPISNARIIYLMAFVFLVIMVASLIFADRYFSSGFVVGGILSFINYYWLNHSLTGILEKATEGTKPTFLAAKYIFRYLFIGTILLFGFLINKNVAIAMICGLSIFVVAVLLEGIFRIFIKTKDI